ncbi:MAG TPA: AraC family transcriptional regulator [Kofleriaceae bacterium]|nr:AraC family transcriptional regulator [Kofleriaceae bacterium]
MTAPWHRARPTGAVDVETDDDDFITVDRWPNEVFRAHYHDAEFNWIVPLRPGRVVIDVDGAELAIDGDHWLCVFPRAPHKVIHVSDDCEVLSLFVPEPTMVAAWDRLAPAPPLARPVIAGGEATIARGLALAWGEQRFARRRRDAFDDALGLFVAGWLWRHYGAPPAEIELAITLRAALGSDGAAIATFFERHLADQPFPWPGLAAALGTSTRTLQRRFTAALGHVPSAALHQMRLERARDLLRDPARPIGDVAIACGFASQAHFATAFRAAFGMSPTQARKR